MEHTDRRAFIIRSAATLAAGPLFGMEACSTNTTAAQPQDIAAFVRFSSALLGIDAAKLAPDAGAQAVASQIYDAAHDADPDALQRLVQAKSVDAALAVSPQDAALAQSIALAWLLGTWYDPKTLDAAQPAGRVLSELAYRQSWVWRIAQTHPSGASDVAFGSWTTAPLPLSHFIGNA